jgi:uncharacterized protein YeaO (DUF488 family)
MALYIRDARIGTRRSRDEGLRIGAVRYVPRGVKKIDYSRLDYFDVWLPILAPSRELLAQYTRTAMSAAAFFERYRTEMKPAEPRQVIELLSRMAQRTPIAVCCYCENPAECHRSVLVDLIRDAVHNPG